MDRSRSPDSSISISSLLASCSLSSNSGTTSSACPIQYKDILYDSASKALEAYIADHEESLRSPAASTGKITIRPSPRHSSAKRKADARVRHKRSPSRKRYGARDPDLLSLTTDDLLCFPSDGSLSFSQASEEKLWKTVKKYHRSSSKNLTVVSSPLTSSNGGRTHPGPSLRFLDLQSPKVPPAFSKENRKMSHLLPNTDRENNPALYKELNPPYLSNGSTFCKNYPRWLTSQKSDLGVSGITSVPDVKYPLWLRDHGLLDGSESKTLPRTFKHSYDSSPGERLQTPFYHSSSDQLGYERVNSSHCTDGKPHPQLCDLDILKPLHTPLTSYPNYSPVQRLEQAFTLSEDNLSQPPLHNGSPRTEDVLEAERSWEKVPYSFKSPVPVLDEESKRHGKSSLVEEFLNDCVKQESNVNTFSGGNHHGPVEALKHMLFNLQTFQLSFTKDSTPGKTEECQEISTDAKADVTLVDKERFPVNKSLEKALHHLSRLKELVGDQDLKPN